MSDAEAASKCATTIAHMKKSILLSTCAILAFALNASAQRDEARIDSARAAIDETREYRGDRDFRQDREFQKSNIRAGYEIDRLNSDVRQLRYEIRGTRTGPGIRERVERLNRDTDRLTALYRQNRLRSWEAYRRAEDLRGEVKRIRWILRGR